MPFRDKKIIVLGSFSFYFEVRKQLIDTPEGIHFGGVVSLHHLPEFSSRSSCLGVLRRALEEAEDWRKGMKGLPKWFSRHGQPSDGVAAIRATLDGCHNILIT